MIIARLNQGIIYFFGKYRKEWNFEIERYLREEELNIFKNMSRYDKIHSYRLMKFVQSDKILKKCENRDLYIRLALLHDCGKDNISLYRRIKKVLWKDSLASAHTEKGYEKLRKLDMDLAEKIREHHSKVENLLMIRFQQLDDR
ncbi:MAG: HD domain-containing protein [Fusobacteriaceae bacterium]